MQVDEAAALIRAAVAPGTAWADLGAGRGTFSRALAQLVGPGGSVLAVDTDARALAGLAGEASIETAVGDYHRLDEIAAVEGRAFDGILFANALHFTSDAEAVLADAARRLRPDGTLLVVEYDRRPASRWVPHPLGIGRLSVIASRIGLGRPELLGERPSDYGGAMYAASLRR